MDLILFKTTSIKIRQFLTDFLTKGHERSIKAKKNIIASFIIKGLSIAISLALVPLTLNYVNPLRYGIWLTLSSIIVWFGFFDIGLGNGLRNKFAQALSRENYVLARIYVSTTYVILSLIMIFVLVLFISFNPFFDWAKILNAPSNMASELSVLTLLVFIFFSLQLVLKLITSIIMANQQSWEVSLINLIGSFISLLFIYILTKTTIGNLIYLAIALGLAPCLVLIIYSYILYSTKYKAFAPSIRLVHLKYSNDLLKIGGAFFIIRIGTLVLFQTDNILISQLLGPQEVTTFNIAFKLFFVLLMGFDIIMTPLWSAYTEAYEKKDYNWMNNVYKKTKKIWLSLLVITLILFSLSPTIFKFWIGDIVHIPMKLSFFMCLFVLLNSWVMLHCFLLNGISKIRIQLYIYIFTIFSNIPLAYYLGKTLGLEGIILSNLLIYILMGVVLYIQSIKILNQTATGLWNK